MPKNLTNKSAGIPPHGSGPAHKPVLTPRFSLHELFGPEVVFTSRPTDEVSQWLPTDNIWYQTASSSLLVVAGASPILCHRNVATPTGLSLLKEAGLDPGPAVVTYGDKNDYRAAVRTLLDQGCRIAVQYISGDEVPLTAHWVAPDLLSWLNNKANMAALVADEYLPYRYLIQPHALADSSAVLAHLPIVVKAVTDLSSGGGVDVRICRTSAELARAGRFFESCESVVVEEFLDIRESYCINFAVTADAEIRYLGAAEQVCDENGMYIGNWLGGDGCPPADAVATAHTVAALAADRGYRGFVGIDMAVLDQDEFKIFDLNFRVNGSTRCLLLAEKIKHHLQAETMRTREWIGAGSFEDMVRHARIAMDRGYLVPLGVFEPQADLPPGTAPRLSGMVVGRDRDQVREREEELAAIGLKLRIWWSGKD